MKLQANRRPKIFGQNREKGMMYTSGFFAILAKKWNRSKMHGEPWGGTRKQIPVAQTPLSLFIWRETAFSQQPTSQTLFQNQYFRPKDPINGQKDLKTCMGGSPRVPLWNYKQIGGQIFLAKIVKKAWWSGLFAILAKRAFSKWALSNKNTGRLHVQSPSHFTDSWLSTIKIFSPWESNPRPSSRKATSLSTPPPRHCE